MKVLWYVAQKDLLQVVKDKNAFIFSLAFPIILCVVSGLMFGNAFGGGDNTGQIAITLAISNQDSGYVGDTLTQALGIDTDQLKLTLQEFADGDQVAQAVRDEKADAGVVIPAGSTDKLQQAIEQDTAVGDLVLVYTPSNSNNLQEPALVVQQIVTGIVDHLVSASRAGSAAVAEVYAVCAQPDNSCVQENIDPAAIANSVANASMIASEQPLVARQAAGPAPKINTYDQILPGYAVFFALFSIGMTASSIMREREDGTFRRLLTAPIDKYALLGGKMLAQFVVTLIQLLILFGFGYLAFRVNMEAWPAILLLLVCTAFATTGLGMAIAALVRTRRQVDPIVSLITLVTAAIGGSWFPLFLMPEWMQPLSKLGIAGWAMEGFNAVMIFGEGMTGAFPNVLGLLGYGAICFVIALLFFRFKQQGA